MLSTTCIFLIFSISLISDESDIVVRKIIDTEIYKKNFKSFCRPKPRNNESTWFEDFDNPQLSRTVWNYSISNGFYDGRTYISGWGNGELQYYTKPKKNKGDQIHPIIIVIRQKIIINGKPVGCIGTNTLFFIESNIDIF